MSLFFSLPVSAASFTPGPLEDGVPIRGWSILSDVVEEGLRVIDRASAYDINHLQISHHLIHDLRHVHESDRLRKARQLTDAAHQAGIQEVLFWDRVLHQLEYYPDKFRTGPNRTLDFDNPSFWEWFRNDYREKLDLAGNIQGLILTFIETGARAERQQSVRWPSNQEKIAAVVNAVADVVIGERGMNLYARTFAYDDEEYDNIVGAIELFTYPQIRLMMKETPHDFFLTHPNDRFAGKLPLPTIIEFDAAGEFNGQGIIANTWPQYILQRWNDFLDRDHIVGYVARTDRYGTTRIVGRPSEMNLWGLKRRFEDATVTSEDIYREFIEEHYGAEAVPYLRRAFGNAYDIITATLYTLGTNVADHSKLNFDPYASSYARHVSGKWIQPPEVFVPHGVNRRFHYWKDVVDQLAPAWIKMAGVHHREIPRVVEAGWLRPEETLTEEMLRHIITQKEYGLRLAKESLDAIERSQSVLSEEDYTFLHHHFMHTLLTARLYRATAAAYWGFRLWCRGDDFRTEFVQTVTREGLLAMREVAGLIREYPVLPPQGQWNWVEDASTAERYWRWIVEEGWPERFHGNVPTGMGGMKFPME